MSSGSSGRLRQLEDFLIADAPGLAAGEVVDAAAQYAGIVYDVSKANGGGITWDVLQGAAPELVKDWGKLIPVVGAYGNLVDAEQIIHDATIPIVPVYEPNAVVPVVPLSP